MKIMTAGAGFVSDHLPYPKIKDRFDLSSKQIDAILDSYAPDVIVNCIGKTGRPNVDWCELHKEETAAANIALPILLAEACAKKSIHLIHIGSGCIYFGQSPHAHKFFDVEDEQYLDSEPGWKEDDFANPKSFYSKTKYACDLAIGAMKNVAVLRIRMPISTQNNPRNLINKLKGYQQVIDIPNSMTFMNDLTHCIDWAAKTSQTGIFHVANPQPLTAAQIMREYKKYVPDHKFIVINEEQLDQLTVAKRSNCILNTDKLTKAGFYMSPSEKALQECMAQYAKNI
jgi:dTDP-4-dehydrorhamnose reductase